jgi:hypothetical protein
VRQFVEMEADRAFLYPVPRHSYSQMSDIKSKNGPGENLSGTILLFMELLPPYSAPVILAEQASAAFLECRCKSSACAA